MQGTISFKKFLNHIEEKVLSGRSIDQEEGLALLNTKREDLFSLLAVTDKVREYYKSSYVSLCSIVNAKSGNCMEDCSFCSQSAHADSEIPVFGFIDKDKVLKGAKSALSNGAHKYGIVTSGYGFSGKGEKGDLDRIYEYIDSLKQDLNIHRCASLGIIDYETALKLKERGLLEYHHNLETSRSFFPNICTTHDYDEDVDTVIAAKKAGLRVCSGGIFGVGESDDDRIELAMTLKELDVDSVPINILNPIKGTKLENQPALPPLKILAIIALFRLILLDKDIKIAGGRDKNLRDLQSMVFAAGANSIMVGSYLTTLGRDPLLDLQMIKDLGLDLVSC